MKLKLYFKHNNGESEEVECDERDITLHNGVLLIQDVAGAFIIRNHKEIIIKVMED